MSDWEDFVAAVHEVFAGIGAPSTREIAESATPPISHTTVNDVVRGKRLARWATVRGVLLAMGVEAVRADGHFHELWAAAYAERRLEDPGGRPAAPLPRVAVWAYEAMAAEELRAIRKLLEERLPVHELDCPDCGATIRARMADR